MIDISLFSGISQMLDAYEIEHAFVECNGEVRDVDVVLSPADLTQAVQCVVCYLNQRSFVVSRVVKKSYIRQIFFLDKVSKRELNVDLMPEFSFRGVPYLSWSEIQKQIDHTSSPPVLKPQFVCCYKEVRRKLQTKGSRGTTSASKNICFYNEICKKILMSNSIKVPFLRFLFWCVLEHPLVSMRGLLINLYFKAHRAGIQ